ncbi:phosphatidylserine decarboxylase-domain-containing protein [Pseudoneurospora amorphoporcata]|uniref:Phosphatidylserine decarboxylase-domain-containing protein n=1 Tax=Pseudoneurospora amorphoporcata TaxID=241081 RepID=A0AAN6NNR1_9PEZI|nr:phosphatidylserine decarboxylase-domain-containing protein [Pseudoneurospora amorphoporcata]
MLILNPQDKNILEGRAKTETSSCTDTTDSSNNNALHDHHQHAYNVPSAKTYSQYSEQTWQGTVSHRQKTLLSREELHDSVKGLWDLIEDNSEVRPLFTQMLQQVPSVPPYDESPTGGPRLRNWTELLCAFNDQLAQGPVWLYDTPGQQGLIGFPFNALLNWSMSTPADLLVLHRPDVNAHLRDILTTYGNFLCSPASVTVLNSSLIGWLSPTALDAIVSTAYLPTITTSTSSEPDPGSRRTDTTADPQPRPRPQFHDLFVSNPLHPTHGFTSWNDFFTRHFRPGIRPTASPSDDGVIVSACESTPVALERGVKLHSEFWVKGQPYSLVTILGEEEEEEDENENEELREAMRFEGGTIYQSFLGALSYHRWHAPVWGVMEKVRKIQGTYFAGCPGLVARQSRHSGEGQQQGGEEEEDEQQLDPSAPDRSQRYLCQVGTRALVYIRARDRRLGTVVFVGVGMAEVSSCEVTVREGYTVEKGEEIGMFHYGGSTHCLIFEPVVWLKFIEAAEEVGIVERRGHDLNLPMDTWRKFIEIIGHTQIHETFELSKCEKVFQKCAL